MWTMTDRDFICMFIVCTTYHIIHHWQSQHTQKVFIWKTFWCGWSNTLNWWILTRMGLATTMRIKMITTTTSPLATASFPRRLSALSVMSYCGWITVGESIQRLYMHYTCSILITLLLNICMGEWVSEWGSSWLSQFPPSIHVLMVEMINC